MMWSMVYDYMRYDSALGLGLRHGVYSPAFGPDGVLVEHRSQLRPVHGRERQPAMTMSASAPSTSPQKSPIGCTSSLYHSLCTFLSFCTQREHEARADSGEQRSKHSSTTTAVGWSVRVPAVGAHAVGRSSEKVDECAAQKRRWCEIKPSKTNT